MKSPGLCATSPGLCATSPGLCAAGPCLCATGSLKSLSPLSNRLSAPKGQIYEGRSYIRVGSKTRECHILHNVGSSQSDTLGYLRVGYRHLLLNQTCRITPYSITSPLVLLLVLLASLLVLSLMILSAPPLMLPLVRLPSLSVFNKARARLTASCWRYLSRRAYTHIRGGEE